jgi:hypothetical protein
VDKKSESIIIRGAPGHDAVATARIKPGARRWHTVMVGRKRCPHGKLKKNCADCNPCPHGKLKRTCSACKNGE